MANNGMEFCVNEDRAKYENLKKRYSRALLILSEREKTLAAKENELAAIKWTMVGVQSRG